MSTLSIPTELPLEATLLKVFPINEHSPTRMGELDYGHIMKDGFPKFWEHFNQARLNNQNIYEGLHFENAKKEVFEWRNIVIKHQGDPRWADQPEGKSPFEAQILIWENRCYPHNHACKRAGYAVLPVYPQDMKDVEYYSKFNDESYTLPPGTVIHKFWRPLDKHAFERVGDENVFASPVAYGGTTLFECAVEEYIKPGEAVHMGPNAFHTLEPLPGHISASLNIYMPPMERVETQNLGGPACQSCPKDTYAACTIMRTQFVENSAREEIVVSPATGSDFTGFMRYPDTTAQQYIL